MTWLFDRSARMLHFSILVILFIALVGTVPGYS